MWATHRCLLPRLSRTTWAHPSKEEAQSRRWQPGAQDPVPAAALPSTQGFRGWHIGREASMAAPPLAHHSTMAFHFYDSPGFLHKHSQLWSFSLPSSQALSSCQQESSPWVCSPNPMFQQPVPVCTSGHRSQTAVCRVMARTICVCLTLSCLPQTSCWALLWAPEAPLCPSWSLCHWGGFSGCRNLSSPSAFSSGAQVLSHFLSSSFSLLSFILPSYTGIFLVLLGVWGTLPVFSRCSVRNVKFVDIFFFLSFLCFGRTTWHVGS